MTLKEVIGTTYEPISLDEAKDHLRVTGTDEDSYIVALITVARKYVENDLGDTLHSATFDYFLDEFPSGDIELPNPPLIDVTHVKYYDADNTLQTLVEDTDYRVDSNAIPGIIEVIDSWPYSYDRTSAVQIRFTAGYDDFSDIDPMAVHAMKIKLALLYDKRDGVDEKMEQGLDKILQKLRKTRF